MRQVKLLHQAAHFQQVQRQEAQRPLLRHLGLCARAWPNISHDEREQQTAGDRHQAKVPQYANQRQPRSTTTTASLLVFIASPV